MPELVYQSAEKPHSIWKRKLRRAGREFSFWYRNLMVSVIEMAILFAVTVVIFGTVFSLLKALWYCYLQTPVGRRLIAGAAALNNQSLAAILNRELAFFSVEIVLAALIACLALSAFCQVFGMRRFFYEGRGLVSKMTWLVMFSAGSGYNLAGTSDFTFTVALALCTLPCLCLFATCLKVTAKILPELTPCGIHELTRRFLKFVTNPE